MRYLYRLREIGKEVPPLPPALLRYAAAAPEGEPRVRRTAAMAALFDAFSYLGEKIEGEIEVSIHGKPYFTEGRLHFNLSHAGDLVAVVLADRRIGIDIEPYDHAVPPDRRARLTALFSEGERALLDAAEDKERTFLEIWVRKEALAKRSGRGIADMKSADTAAILPTNEERVIYEGRVYYMAIY